MRSAASGRPLRVLHAPALVGGHPGSLAAAERAIGLKSHCVAFRASPYGYRHDETLWDGCDSVWRQEIRRWRLVMRALSSFDVVHFNFGMSIMPAGTDERPAAAGQARRLRRNLYSAYARALTLKDLPLLKRSGKAVFVTYQGDDARQGDYCRRHFDIHFAHEVGLDYYTPAGDARRREEIAAFDRHADRVYALNPDLLHVLPGRAGFLPYAHVDPGARRPGAYRPGSRSRPVVVHAPSNRAVKGTRYLVEAVERLKAEGVGLDLVLIEGLSNAEAFKLYESADLAVDQLLAGWYGGFAVEMMALAKPVICYIRESDLGFIPPAMRSQLPLIRAEPATIYEVLKAALATPSERLARIGADGRAYVGRWHDPARIARHLRDEYAAALEERRPGRASPLA
jgi:hypothetical protein